MRTPLVCPLVLGLIWLCGACATTTPVEEPSAPADPTARIEAPRIDAPAVAPVTEEIPRFAPTPTEQERFRFALRVLERKGARKLNAAQREGVARALVAAEVEHGLPLTLSLAIIELESRFNPRAKGPAGSIGLMQLQPATARETAERYGFRWTNNRMLLDPEQNARLGLAYLAELRRKFGTTEHAVAAYNIGPANLRRLLARRPLRRGPYLTKVFAHVDALHEEYGE